MESLPHLPLRRVVLVWFFLTRWLSPHFWIFGENPESPRWYFRGKRRTLNYHTFHDLYIMCCWTISLGGTIVSLRLSCGWAAIVLMFLVAVRLHELFRSLVKTLLTLKKRQHRPLERTFAMTLAAYTEPILLFAIMHTFLPVALGMRAEEVYNLTGPEWQWADVIHYSVACYTTVGWGEIHALYGASRILSSVETGYGVMMLVFTITAFISRLYGVKS